jgi:CDP-glycerol glycerophosphotransferase (TagB/SpsB family)
MSEKGYRAVGMFSLSSILDTIRAGNIAYTHGEEDFLWPLTGGATLINMWHGTPLKKLGAFDKKSKRVQRSMIAIPDGDMTEKHFIETFQLGSKDICRTGSPRNEAIVSKQLQDTAIDIQQVCHDWEFIHEIDSRVLFVPTWRMGYSAGDIVDFDYLEAHLPRGVHVFMKSHTHDKFVLDGKYKNIHQIPKGRDVYASLNKFDLLITDYSSILFDYLHVDRPIILFRPDDEEYQDARGTYDHIDAMIPADRVESESELVDAISRNLAEDPYADERSEVKDQFVSDPTGACSRIAALNST